MIGNWDWIRNVLGNALKNKHFYLNYNIYPKPQIYINQLLCCTNKRFLLTRAPFEILWNWESCHVSSMFFCGKNNGLSCGNPVYIPILYGYHRAEHLHKRESNHRYVLHYILLHFLKWATVVGDFHLRNKAMPNPFHILVFTYICTNIYALYAVCFCTYVHVWQQHCVRGMKWCYQERPKHATATYNWTTHQVVWHYISGHMNRKCFEFTEERGAIYWLVAYFHTNPKLIHPNRGKLSIIGEK